MDLASAIYKRKSVRKYQDKKLSQELLDEIAKICKEEERLYKDIDLNIAIAEEGEYVQKIMSGLVGNFGKVIAPHYIIVTSELKLGYMENAGYTLEKIVLKLASMGIATCWLGGHVKEYELKEVIGITMNHEYVIMVSLGYAQDMDNLYRKNPSEVKRKDISELVIGNYDSMWQEFLEAVRVAPSAANTQPWRFAFEGNKAHVFCEGPSNFITKKLLGDINVLDVGIGLSHMAIIGEKLGKKLNITRESHDKEKQGQYIATVELL